MTLLYDVIMMTSVKISRHQNNVTKFSIFNLLP